MYIDGAGVPQDHFEGIKWFLKAAEQGLAMAQRNLGMVYEKGLGVSPDRTEALKWYQRACAPGR